MPFCCGWSVLLQKTLLLMSSPCYCSRIAFLLINQPTAKYLPFINLCKTQCLHLHQAFTQPGTPQSTECTWPDYHCLHLGLLQLTLFPEMRASSTWVVYTTLATYRHAVCQSSSLNLVTGIRVFSELVCRNSWQGQCRNVDDRIRIWCNLGEYWLVISVIFVNDWRIGILLMDI